MVCTFAQSVDLKNEVKKRLDAAHLSARKRSFSMTEVSKA